MREIKFRAWEAANARILNWEFIKSHLIMPGHSGWEWSQYTGLKDKNGKEIYEGDILRVDYSKRVIEVAWRKGSWVANYQGEYLCPLMGIPGFAGYESEEIEVIGNIYENPELLGVNNAKS